VTIADDFAAKHNLQLLQFVLATEDKIGSDKGNMTTYRSTPCPEKRVYSIVCVTLTDLKIFS